MKNTWPNGKKQAFHQDEHERWNENNYPGTRQLCSICDEPTGRCEEDAIWTEDGEPLCESCYTKKGDEMYNVWYNVQGRYRI